MGKLEDKRYGELMECMECQKFVREKQLVLTPTGMKCDKCLKEEDIEDDMPTGQRTSYFPNEKKEGEDDCE